MTWTTLAPILVSIFTALGLSELLKLLVTRRSRSTGDQKVKAETEAVISGQLLGWTTQAEARASRAEQRADKADERAEETEQRMQVRIDALCAQMEGVKQEMRSLEQELSRMRVLIRDCGAGPPCPVRIAIDARPA